jgi:GT2 family glycosyltransferase
MQPDEQLYIARLVHEQRGHIEDTVRALVERGTSLSELEGRLLAYNSTSLLAEIEYRLRQDALDQDRRRPPQAGSHLLWRIRGLTVPKIGRLHHYVPRPLRVPEAYLRAAPPADPPTMSIVTPSFQQGRYVGRTIFSVVNQQYPALEYIVQDGGSTDGTLDVLQRFDGDLTRWVSEPDLGQADAINRGFDGTTGEIMAWLNSDDLLLPGTLPYVGSYFARHPDVDVVYGNRMLIDENDGDIGVWVLPKHDDRMLTNIDYVPQETLFWRRRIWESAGGRIDPGFDYALDWDLLLRFRQAGAKIVRLPRFLGAFRVHDEQKTTAQDRVGAAECARLRERVHGRPVSHEEAVGQTVSYLRRHLLVHARHRLVERFSQPEVDVLTAPPPVDPPQPGSGVEAQPFARDDALPQQYARRVSEQVQDAQAVEQNKEFLVDS